MKTISIIGGGIAGLSLGIALRQQEVPVTLYEAGTYPRHRVCGELICGANADTLNRLGILHHLVDAEQCSSMGWYLNNTLFFQETLPVAAFGISRYLLDYRMSRQFRKVGGRLFDETRYLQAQNLEGRVWATGRLTEAKSEWIALKLHCDGLHLTHDIELHFGEHCYIYLSRIEDGLTNMCGLFKKRKNINAKRHGIPFAYLKACGLERLAERLVKGRPDPQSILGLNKINFTETQPYSDRFALGDHYTMAPPFTLNGVSIAMESAEIALDPIVHFSKGALSWEEALAALKKGQHKKFDKRLKHARKIHPLFYNPSGQRLLSQLARFKLLPFLSSFRRTH